MTIRSMAANHGQVRGQLPNRILVALLALLWGITASPIPVSLNGWGTAVVAGALAIFVILGHRTRWLALPLRQDHDEFQAHLRALPYRLSFRLFLLGVLLLIPMLVAGADQGGTSITWGVPDPLGPRAIAAAFLLLLVLPTAVGAWIAPSPSGDGEPPDTGARSSAATVSLGALLAVLLGAWLVGIQALPASGATKATIPDPQDYVSGATCGAFSAVSELDRGFGPSLVMLAQVCWNGRAVWLANSPARPSGRRRQPYLATALPTFCSQTADGTDFGILARQRCRVWVDGSGAIHVTMSADAASGLPGLAARQLRLNLVVTNTGRVLSFD